MTPGLVGDVRRIGESVGDAVVTHLGRAASRLHEKRGLPADVLESDDAYLVVFDAPGAAVEDVAVRCDDRTVAVRVERYRDHREGFTMRFPGRGQSLTGVADLPEGARVDAESATADLTGTGALQITLPKLDDAAAEPVEVQGPDETAQDPPG